jgi:hypothetical protein
MSPSFSELSVILDGIESASPEEAMRKLTMADMVRLSNNQDLARSLRSDLGCNMLFEQLVVELGYEAEAARQVRPRGRRGRGAGEDRLMTEA